MGQAPLPRKLPPPPPRRPTRPTMQRRVASLAMPACRSTLAPQIVAQRSALIAMVGNVGEHADEVLGRQIALDAIDFALARRSGSEVCDLTRPVGKELDGRSAAHAILGGELL